MIAAVLGWWFFARPQPQVVSFRQPSPGSVSPFSYENYRAALANTVDSSGMVDYRSLKENRTKLDAFSAQLEVLSPAIYSSWDEKERIAFWINAYNALTLEAIINHYPIQPSLVRSVLFPKNSIRQIPGVWDEMRFPVMGETITLDKMEHEILRGRFREPRIHVALVCASKGCPPLRNEPFVGERLDEQLADQTRRFLSDSQKFQIDRRAGRVYLSPIFDWFGSDFVLAAASGQNSSPSEAENAVIDFISKYVKDDDRNYLNRREYKVKYLDYDWSLNEKVAGKEIS